LAWRPDSQSIPCGAGTFGVADETVLDVGFPEDFAGGKGC
jgi:hypothetical protein